MSLRAFIALLLCALAFGGGAAAFEGLAERSLGGGDCGECCCGAHALESGQACDQAHAAQPDATSPNEDASRKNGCAPCNPCNAPAQRGASPALDRALTAQTQRLKARRNAAHSRHARTAALPFYAPFLTATSSDDAHAFAKATDPTPATRAPPLRVTQCRFLI